MRERGRGTADAADLGRGEASEQPRQAGLDFADAEAVFRGAVFIFEDKRGTYGEQRFVALGMLREIVVVIVFTEPEEESIRIISMRKAIRNEQQIYFERLSD